MSTALEFDKRFNNYKSIIQDNENLIGLCEGKNAPNCSFVTGMAGTGKTFKTKAEVERNPKENLLAATTGIAAVNLGNDSKTIHSYLRFFDDDSIRRNYQIGQIHISLENLYQRGVRKIRIDEASMLSANMGNHIVEAIADFNQYLLEGEEPISLELIGDFCQLPPVQGEFIFTGNCWKFFEPNIERLTKIWRQDNPDFISALNMLRSGNGREAAYLLQKCGVEYKARANPEFDGTTLISKNAGVDTFNYSRLERLNGKTIVSNPAISGIAAKEWTNNIRRSEFKIGAYVMILCNQIPDFTYVNGDCGEIVDYDSNIDAFFVKLVRTGETVRIKRILRENCAEEKELSPSQQNAPFKPYLNREGKWVLGTISYHPLRLAWASTVHKSQGLSLDKLQIEIKDRFFAYPSMSYVAISRARKPENLIIVGSPSELAAKTKIAPEVKKWI